MIVTTRRYGHTGSSNSNVRRMPTAINTTAASIRTIASSTCFRATCPLHRCRREQPSVCVVDPLQLPVHFAKFRLKAFEPTESLSRRIGNAVVTEHSFLRPVVSGFLEHRFEGATGNVMQTAFGSPNLNRDSVTVVRLIVNQQSNANADERQETDQCERVDEEVGHHFTRLTVWLRTSAIASAPRSLSP